MTLAYKTIIIKTSLLLVLVGALSVIGTTLFMAPARTFALSGDEFKAGRIIDDGVFFNANTMNAQSIHSFLVAKVPTCDTNGAQRHSSGQTRAQYGTSVGVPPPYTCLKDFAQETPNRNAENGLCGAYGGGYKSAAQIINDVAKACGVNPQILLVLLQKEQSLVSDDWPWPVEYRSATGFGCPDTAPCDAEYYGFFNQVYNAARIYKKYARDSHLYNYRAGRNNYIQYNPNGACGGSNVFIENQATAGLYVYTPYQPNRSALNNLYGSGDSCGAYGNRNFWRMYNDWFGSTIGCPYVDSSYIYRLYRISDNDYIYTQNGAEICSAVKQYGYVIEGKVMTSMSPNEPGARSLFRLSRNGIHLYTTDPNEVSLAMSKYQYVYEGVSYYVNSMQTGSNYPVHRLSRNGHYVLTGSHAEKESFQATGYSYEGIMFYAQSPSEKIPVYRLSRNGIHLYTPDPIERSLAISLNGFSDEGIGFYAQSGVTGDTNTVFRLERGSRYLFTSNINERGAARVSNYRQETSFFYVYLPNYPGTVPVHRLVNPTNGDYLLTTNSSEKDQAISLYGYRYEGVVFNGSP